MCVLREQYIDIVPKVRYILLLLGKEREGGTILASQTVKGRLSGRFNVALRPETVRGFKGGIPGQQPRLSPSSEVAGHVALLLVLVQLLPLLDLRWSLNLWLASAPPAVTTVSFTQVVQPCCVLPDSPLQIQIVALVATNTSFLVLSTGGQKRCCSKDCTAKHAAFDCSIYIAGGPTRLGTTRLSSVLIQHVLYASVSSVVSV